MNVWFLLWTGLCTLIDNCWAKDHSCSWQPHEWQQKPWPWWQQMGSLANESVFEGSPVKKNHILNQRLLKMGMRDEKETWDVKQYIEQYMATQEMWLYLLYMFNLYFTWKHCMGDWFSKLFWEIDFHVSVKTIR